MTRWGYRTRQFFTALAGKISAEDLAEARRVLGPRLYRVFASMPKQYQRHALNVYERAREGGYYDLAVLQAALLHDCGKYDSAGGRYVTVLHRVAVVLLGAIPGGRHALDALSRSGNSWGLGGWLLYPFYLSKHHARLGAEVAARHGASDEVVDLIERHQDDAGRDARLLALQEADSRE